MSLSSRFDTVYVEMYNTSFHELDFDKIPPSDRLHPSRDLCGMLYLANKMKDPSQFGLHGEHYYIYFSVNDEGDLKEPLTDEDIKYLIRCGIKWMSEGDSLGMYASL